MASENPQFEVVVDGKRSWSTHSEFAEYDATHAVAGALLAGADEVTVTRQTDTDPQQGGQDADNSSQRGEPR